MINTFPGCLNKRMKSLGFFFALPPAREEKGGGLLDSSCSRGHEPVPLHPFSRHALSLERCEAIL